MKKLTTHVISRNGGIFTNEFFGNSGEYSSLDNVEVHNVKGTVIEPKRSHYTFGGWKDSDGNILVKFYKTNGINPHIGIDGVSKNYVYIDCLRDGKVYVPIWYDLEVPVINSIVTTTNFTTNQTSTISAKDNGNGIAGYYIGKVEPTETAYKQNKFSFTSSSNNTYSKVIDSTGIWYFAVIDKDGNWTYQSREYYRVNIDLSQSVIDRNNLSCTITSMIAEKNTTIELPTITTTGYTARTWKTGNNTITSLKVSSDGITIAPVWVVNSYTLTFNANGGSCSTPSKTINYKSAYGTLPVPSRTGYTFTGWYTDPNGGSRVSENTIMGVNDVTVYAHWQINNYTIYFNANGGSCSTPSKVATYGNQYGTLPTPSATGYEFTGWFTDPNGGSQVSTSTTMGASDITVYAHWIGIFSVSINNGSAVYSGTSTTGNAQINVSQNISYTVYYGLSYGSYTTTSMPTFKDTGTYTVYFKISAGGYRDYYNSYTVTITKADATLDLSSYSGTVQYPNSASFTVSSNISLDYLSMSSSNTNIATVTRNGSTVYVNPVSTGTTTINFSIGNSNYNNASRTYTITINQGTISYTASSYSGQYDGSAHSPTLVVNTEGCTVMYGASSGVYNITSMPSYADAGIHTVYYQITKTNYETVTGYMYVILRRSTPLNIYEQSSGLVDVRTDATQTTYADYGYETRATCYNGLGSVENTTINNSNVPVILIDGVTCTRKVYKNELGQVVFEWYFVNNSGSDVYVGASIDADLDVGSDDNVPCIGTDTGFYMTSTYTFDFFCRNYPGVKYNATGIWVGKYNERTNYLSYTGTDNSCSGIDSGMAVNWQDILIPNGSSDSIMCILDMR